MGLVLRTRELCPNTVRLDSALVTLTNTKHNVCCIRDSQTVAGGPLLTTDASVKVREIAFTYFL
jgi:hypothetical protein